MKPTLRFLPPVLLSGIFAGILSPLPLSSAIAAEETATGTKDAFLQKKAEAEADDGEKKDTSGKAPFETPKAEPTDKVRDAIQVTELGLMRTLVVFDEGIDDALVKIVNQRLSDVHFRVFESSTRTPKSGADNDALRKLGEEAHADLVLHASVTPREKKAFGNAKLYEAEATVKFVSPVNGELMVTQTGRADGVRKFDAVEAERSATEKVLDAVVREAAVKALEKSNKIIIYEVEMANVPSNLHVLRIKDHIAKLQGVYHVREISYDPKELVSTLEVIGSPKMLTFLKAHIETMPKLPADAKQ
ncbi:MAG: hypothetical protein KDL87_13665 [Verrucomicrobiae bacterium]|nr:hypothetical protein [Verrucomicrobiae bacterium]